ncbi:MAG: hypothetical protein R3B07_34310, partial [Polyangiaceae bacterium]
MAYLRNRLWTVMACLALVLAGCSSDPANQPSAPGAMPAAPTQEASPELTLSVVMHNAHFAFRPVGKAFRGGHDTYDAAVDSSGLQIAPAGHGDSEPAPLHLLTTSVAGMRSDGSAPALRGGQLVTQRGPALEVLENTKDGVEQSWEFASRPELGGEDLVIHVGVSGQEFTGASERGLHFADSGTGLGFRYGLATWVDAEGKRTRVVPTFSHGEIIIRVPANVVANSDFPAVLDPTVGPEFGMDNPVYVAEPREQFLSVIACATSNCLVAWVDRRTNTSRISATRLDASGAPLDPWGIDIPAALDYSQTRLNVASDGTNYMVVWETDPAKIMGARISGGGKVMDPTGIPIETQRYYNQSPDIAFDGTNYLVVYDSQGSTGTGIFGRRVSPSGIVLDSTSITISSSSAHYRFPTVAFNGTDYFVAWQDSRNKPNLPITYGDIYGSRVTTAGIVRDPASIHVATITADEPL